MIENDHRNHILDVSMAPAGVSDGVAGGGGDTRAVLEKLGVVGVLCVEFFLTGRGSCSLTSWRLGRIIRGI